MGVAISRSEDSVLYKETYEEAQRIIRISDEVRISLEKIPQKEEDLKNNSEGKEKSTKLTTSKLAKKLGKTTDDLNKVLLEKDYLKEVSGKIVLTEKGKLAGGEYKKGRYGAYFLWNEELVI